MSWRCPVCGNSENMNETFRCICGNEINVEEIEKYKSEPTVASNQYEEYSDDNRLGEGSRLFHLLITTLFWLTLGAFVSFEYFADRRFTSFTPGLLFFFIIVLLTAETIVKKQVHVRTFVLKKTKNPTTYYAFLFFYIAVGFVLAAKLIYELKK